MSRLVYLEGPDCAGKTTLIEKQLREDGDIFHHNKQFSSPDAAFAAYNQQLDVFELSSRDMIIDRGPIAEKIYGFVMRKTEADIDDFSDLMRRYAKLDVDFILCLPPWSICFNKWMDRRSTEYVKDALDFMKIYELYEHVLKGTLNLPFKVTQYDFTAVENFDNDIIN